MVKHIRYYKQKGLKRQGKNNHWRG